jgi:hypothetical protein
MSSGRINWFGDQDQCIVYSSNMAVGSRFQPWTANAETLVGQQFSALIITSQSVQDQLEGLLVRVQSGEQIQGL